MFTKGSKFLFQSDTSCIVVKVPVEMHPEGFIENTAKEPLRDTVYGNRIQMKKKGKLWTKRN